MDNNTDSLGARVRAQRILKGWTQWRLALEVTRAGFPLKQSAIGNIEAGMVDSPRCIVHLAQVLSVEPAWLQTGKGPRVSDVQNNTLPTANLSDKSYLPLYRTATNGEAQHGVFRLRSRSTGPVDRPEFLSHALRAFAMRVHDNLNAPAFRAGDVLVTDPEQRAHVGDDAVFTNEAGMPEEDGADSVIGHLLAETKDSWKVMQYSTSTEFTLLKTEYPHAFKILQRQLR